MRSGRIIFFILVILAVAIGAIFIVQSYNIFPDSNVYYSRPNLEFWSLRSIDTMKYSRDLSREKLNNPEFDLEIERQMKNIAALGATHVAIGTPYDAEFLPILKRWISAARKYDLKIWFRGNWSGWEGWFDYPKINQIEHMEKTRMFILANPELFQDDDIFSGCPECENGGTGDPRSTGDVEGFRNFITEEYRQTKFAFKSLNKRVSSNYYSMNADVARLVMDKSTTTALDGIVTVDHYISDPEKMAKDIKDIARESGGKIVLGEFGAPIPDIHGNLSETEQSEWINSALWSLKDLNEITGINYWSAVGGSTAIWEDGGRERLAVGVFNKYFKPQAVYGVINDELGNPIKNAKISYSGREIYSNERGYFEFPFVQSENGDTSIKFSASGYLGKEIIPDPNRGQIKQVLAKENEDAAFKFAKYIRRLYQNE